MFQRQKQHLVSGEKLENAGKGNEEKKIKMHLQSYHATVTTLYTCSVSIWPFS